MVLPLNPRISDFAGDTTASGRVDTGTLDAEVIDLHANDQALANFIALLIRDDGTLVPNAVKLFQLHPEVSSILGSPAGWQPKEAVRVATTANVAALTGLLTIDSVLLIAGDRVLVKNQTLPEQNGIYVAAVGAWARAGDAETADELGYAVTAVLAGLTNIGTSWIATVAAADLTVGTTPLPFVNLFTPTGIIASVLANVPARFAVQAVATFNVVIAAPGASLDSYVFSVGDRLLLVGQAVPSENGLWAWNGAATPLSRPGDYLTGLAVTSITVDALNGTRGVGTRWRLATVGAVVVDVTATTWRTLQSGEQSVLPACRVVSTVNISIAATPANIDGVAVVLGDRVLLTGQGVGSQNGPWLINGVGLPATRPLDWSPFNDLRSVQNALLVPITEGTFRQDFWRLTSVVAVTVDVTATTWVRQSAGQLLREPLKYPVRVSALADYNLAAPAGTVDGILLAVGNRVLLPFQTVPSQNGIWEWDGAQLIRPSDYISTLAPATIINLLAAVSEGAIYGGAFFRCVTGTAVTVDTTNTTWALVRVPTVSLPPNIGLVARNLLVNGDGRFARRITTTSIVSGTYAYGNCDRWRGALVGTVVNGALTTMSTPLFPPKNNAVQYIINNVTGAGQAFIAQRIESRDAKTLAAAGVGAFRCTVRHDCGVPINVQLTVRYATLTDNFAATILIATNATQVSSATNTTIILEGFAVPPAAITGIEVEIRFDIGAQAAKNVYLTDAQLEPAAMSSAFAARLYADELAMCQRYYWKTFATDVIPAQASGTLLGVLAYRVMIAGVGGMNSMMVRFGVPMRAVPTLTFFNPQVANALWRDIVALSDSGVATALASVISAEGFMVNNAQTAAEAIGDNMGIHATADAEL